MIIGTNSFISETEKLLVKMSDSAHVFNLTGSRFFGTSETSSDWDFFIEYSKDNSDVATWLIENGFTFLEESQYDGDGQCLMVYEFKEKYKESLGDTRDQQATQIQVQLVKDSTVKSLIQNKLLEMFPKSNFPRQKSEARIIWKTAFTFFEISQT